MAHLMSAVAVLLLGLVASCVAAPRPPPRWRSVDDYVEDTPEHRSLYRQIVATDVDDFLEPTNFRGTFIAPTNLAFNRSSAAIARLTRNQIADVLKYHIVPGSRINLTADFAANRTLRTVLGPTVRLSRGVNNTRLVNGVPITRVVNIANGRARVLVVESILLPPNLRG